VGLIDLETNLKSLRYGKDTLGGGNSNEPFITQSIPGSFSNIGDTGGTDFLLRANTLGASARDVSRLTQLLLTPGTSRGRLFTAKQNVLSLTNVDSSTGYAPLLPVSLKGTFKSNADTFLGKALEIGTNIFQVGAKIGSFVNSKVQDINPINQGVYSPTSTIAQAGVNAFGTHLNKQGLNPFKNTTNFTVGGNLPLALPTYLNTIGGLGIEGPKTRMEGLFIKQLGSSNPSDTNLISYFGGPGATLGVGRTIIKVAPGQPSGRGSSVFLIANDPRYNSGNGNNVTNRFVLSQNEINLITPVGIGAGATYQNFSAPLVSESVPKSIPWDTNPNLRMDERVNLGDPGKRANRSSYTIGRRVLGKTSPDTVEGNSRYDRALDKLNALPLYQSTGPADTPFTTKERNDLVKFRIGVINNNNPSKKTYIHFRALIDSMSDNYSSEWEAQKFMGRGENFYKYSGFDRQISLSWTVAAQSKQELIPMYQKLNYLASVCAPDYSGNGYMRGNLISLTVGGWCYEQVGIMKGINLEVPTESPWEIGIGDTLVKTESNLDGSINDASVKELPMIVKVTGFTFVPIHNFVPKIQSNLYGGNKNPAENANGPISTYGNEKYIGLTIGGDGDNYNGKNGNINYISQS
jgi:hypothetical protein